MVVILMEYFNATTILIERLSLVKSYVDIKRFQILVMISQNSGLPQVIHLRFCFRWTKVCSGLFLYSSQISFMIYHFDMCIRY